MLSIQESGPDLDLHEKEDIEIALCIKKARSLSEIPFVEHHKGMASCSLQPRLYLVRITDIGIWGFFSPFFCSWLNLVWPQKELCAAKELQLRFVPAARSALGTSLADSGIEADTQDSP